MATDIREKLVLETVKTLNTVSEHYTAGQEWDWVRGMLQRHIGLLISRSANVDDISIIRDNLTKETILTISHYFRRTAKAGVDILPQVATLKHIGVMLPLPDGMGG